jgi:hypothetical protein
MATTLAITVPVRRPFARRTPRVTMEPVGDAVIYVRIPAETADKLAAVAASKGRSMADVVRSLIAKAVK